MCFKGFFLCLLNTVEKNASFYFILDLKMSYLLTFVNSYSMVPIFLSSPFVLREMNVQKTKRTVGYMCYSGCIKISGKNKLPN